VDEMVRGEDRKSNPTGEVNVTLGTTLFTDTVTGDAPNPSLPRKLESFKPTMYLTPSSKYRFGIMTIEFTSLICKLFRYVSTVLAF
jgi:hypothetical protein